MKNITIMYQIWKHGLMSAMEYKISFVTQAGFMILNNIFLILVFYFFFLKFQTIGGLGFFQRVILFAIFGFVFSYIFLFMGGLMHISDYIKNGKLDNYLMLPIHPLISILPSNFSVSAIGDMITSFAIFYLVYIFSDLSILSIFLLILKCMIVALFGALVLLGFMLFFQSLAFFIGSSDKLAYSSLQALLLPTMYPPEVYTGTILKPIFMTILPVFYTTYLPFKLITEFAIIDFVYLCIATIIFLAIGFATFQLGLKKYESGSNINTNV